MDAPRVQFVTTNDGVRIAHASFGDGPPLIVLPGWVSHLERSMDGRLGQFLERLARSHRITTYDGRGTGLSDRNVDDFSVAARLRDLEAVLDQLGQPRFSLFAWSQSTPVAMTYTGTHPDRVERLILFAAFCGGYSGEERDGALLQALLDLMRAEWGVGARTTMGFVHPDADREEMEDELSFLRASATGDVAARILEEGYRNTDVREFLPRITAPTLVMHRRGDKAVDVESGRIVASLIQDSRLVVFDGDHHMPFDWDSEPVLRAMEEFLGVERRAPALAAHEHHERTHTHDAPVAILFTDMEGSTSLTQRLGDAGAQERLRAHNDVVRTALKAHAGEEIKHTGDGIMASFASSSRALECAIAIQRELARYNREHPEAAISVRIGLNAGEPVHEQRDLFGHAVQLARRICDRAQPGQILASNVVRELVAGKGFLFADQGESALRGFEDPVRLYEVRWAD